MNRGDDAAGHAALFPNGEAARALALETDSMLDERIVYLNGDFVKWQQAAVHMMSHSFGRGSAVFEVLSVHETDRGPCVFRLDRHLERLFRTAELLNMTLPISPEALSAACLQTVSRNGIRQGFIKVICYYGQVAFDILPPEGPMDVAVFALDPAADLEKSPFYSENGVSAAFSSWRKLDPQTIPVEAKAAANYLNGMLARNDARRRGFDLVILLDTQGFVAEGATEAVFMVENGVLHTACPGTVLLSITRRSLLEAAASLGIETREERMHPDRLLSAAEVFFAGTPSKVLPINQIEDRRIDAAPGPVTRRLSALMHEIVSGRRQPFNDWLFPVR